MEDERSGVKRKDQKERPSTSSPPLTSYREPQRGTPRTWDGRVTT